MCPNCRSTDVTYREGYLDKAVYKVQCKCNNCHCDFYGNYYPDPVRKKVFRVASKRNNLTAYGVKILRDKGCQQDRLSFGEVYGTLYDSICSDRMQKEEQLKKKADKMFFDAFLNMNKIRIALFVLLHIIFLIFVCSLIHSIMNDEDINTYIGFILSAVTTVVLWLIVHPRIRFVFDENTMEKEIVRKKQRKRIKEIKKCINDIALLKEVSYDDFWVYVNKEGI